MMVLPRVTLDFAEQSSSLLVRVRFTRKLAVEIVKGAQGQTPDPDHRSFLVVHQILNINKIHSPKTENIGKVNFEGYISQIQATRNFLEIQLINSDQIMEAEQETQQGRSLLQMLGSTNQMGIIEGVLDFLDAQEVSALGEVGLRCGVETALFRVALARAFMGKYLNRVDRTVFFIFYEDVDFRSIEKHTSNILASRHSALMIQGYNSYKQLFKAFYTHSQYLNNQEEFLNLLEQLFLEPDLPMPKLKRQMIGMYCETALQQHLSLVRFPPDQLEPMWEEPAIEQLREQLQIQLEVITDQLIYSDYGNEELISKIRTIRFCGFRVGLNWKDYLIPDFKCHNLIVLLLALCSRMVDTFHQLLAAIEDPFMRFTEFTLRSNIYRNIVLSIEEKMGFVFSNYSEFYSVCFKPEKEFPAFNFWRPALSIWTQQMKSFHPENQKVYSYVTSKIREQNLKEILLIKTEKLPSFFSELKREIDLQTFSLTRKQSIYQHNNLQMEAYFENNQDMYEALAKDYIEYMVDISMNEFNVHWCGHSDHCIKNYPLFKPFLQGIVEETSTFYRFIEQIVNLSVPIELRLNIFKEVIKEDLSFSEERLFKPMIAKEIAATVNSQIKEKVQLMSQYVVFNEEGFLKHKISMDFEEKDGLLTYFAGKYAISEDCPPEFKFYYNIQIENQEPVWMKEEGEGEEQMEQYISDSEEMVDENDEK